MLETLTRFALAFHCVTAQRVLLIYTTAFIYSIVVFGYSESNFLSCFFARSIVW